MTTDLGRHRTLDLTPTVTAGAYTANDVIGGLLTLPMERVSGLIEDVVVIDDANQSAAIDLYFFDEAPTAIADNAAFAPTIADLQKLIGVVSVAGGDYTTVNSNAYATKALDVGFESKQAFNIYVYAVVTGTPTFAATTDLTLRFKVNLD